MAPTATRLTVLSTTPSGTESKYERQTKLAERQLNLTAEPAIHAPSQDFPVKTSTHETKSISLNDLKIMMLHFVRSSDPVSRRAGNENILKMISENCKALLRKDYDIGIVSNENGELSASYPPEILIIEKEKKRYKDKQDIAEEIQIAMASTFNEEKFNSQRRNLDEDNLEMDFLEHIEASETDEGGFKVVDLDCAVELCSLNMAEDDNMEFSSRRKKVNDAESLTNYFRKCRFSRVRSRFVVPVIFCRGKNICRSGTLSNEAEVLLNKIQDRTRSFWYGAPVTSDDELSRNDKELFESNKSVEKNRQADIELLRKLRVKYINDLMMEHRKVKFGLTVTSSEKADSFNRYFHAGFSLLALPYPGVECFRNFKDNGHCARQLNVDWTQGFADANLSLPMDDLPEVLSEIDWRSYKKWDLVRLTQTYLKLFIKCIEQPSKGEDDLGLLIHCISGWDRTPLFVSLLRLSLWADGEIHTSLSPAEMLYFTIGYDWLLFSHLLADRTSRGEDIFLFCFYFLQFVMTDDFAITPRVPPKTLDTANPKPPPDAEAPNLQVGSWQMVSLANSLSTTPERARIDKPDSPLGLDINEGPKKSPVGVFHRTSAPRPIVREMGAIGSWSRNTITSSNSNEAVAIGSPHTQHNASRPHSLTHQNSFAKVSVPSHTPSPHSMDSFGKISFEEARNRNRKSSSLPESPLSTTPDSPMFDEFITGTTPPTLLSHMETKSSRSSSLIVPSPSSGHLKSRKSLISIQSESSLASSFASVQFSKSTSINNIANVEQSGGAYLLSKCQCCVDETPQVDISTCFKPVELPVESNVTDETGYMETEHMENIPNMRQEKLQAIRFLFSQIHGEYISGMQEQVQEKKRSDLESLSAVVPQIPPTIGGGTVSTIWNWMSSSQTENSTTAEESSGKAASPKKYASLSRRFSSPSLVIGKSGGDSDASESHLSQEPVLHRDADMKEERPKNSHFTRPTLVLASQQYRQQRSRIGFTGPKRRTNSPPEVSGQQATFENVTMQQHSSVSTAYSSPMSNPVSKEKERGEKVTGSPVPETTRKTSENLKRSASAKRSGASSQGSGTGSFKDWYRK